MIPYKDLQIKIADSEGEFEKIHRLNYCTFAEEIPQHERNESGYLIDRFHEENTYIIVLDGENLAGMMAVRGNRPFSLDDKIPDLERYLPSERRICEIRLLAVKMEYRGGPVFFYLMKKAAEYCMAQGFDYAVISGTTRQQKLYRHLGFKPFHPRVGKQGAYFIPMCASAQDFQERLAYLKTPRLTVSPPY